jgi:serine/threonine protein kinase
LFFFFAFQYDGKADIWSLGAFFFFSALGSVVILLTKLFLFLEGITCIEMAEMEPPYSGVHPMRALFIIPNSPPPKLQNPTLWSDTFHDFLKACLFMDPSKRPTAKKLLKVPHTQTSLFSFSFSLLLSLFTASLPP